MMPRSPMLTPVFCFLGFLDSGKTSLLCDLLEAESFSKVPTLLLVDEEGDQELSWPPSYTGLITTLPYSADREVLLSLSAKVQARQVILEYNGMRSLDELAENLPGSWFIQQTFLTVDASDFSMYLKNMRQLTVEKLKMCSQVFFNRVEPAQDTDPLRRAVRACNFKADIFYERTDGSFEQDEKKDLLPYDLSMPEFEVPEEAYGIFQLHLQTFPEKYLHKTITFTGRLLAGGENLMQIGRPVMTCCEADIEWICFPLKKPAFDLPSAGSWVRAAVAVENDPAKGRFGIIMQPLKVQLQAAPASELAFMLPF